MLIIVSAYVLQCGGNLSERKNGKQAVSLPSEKLKSSRRYFGEGVTGARS